MQTQKNVATILVNSKQHDVDFKLENIYTIVVQKHTQDDVYIALPTKLAKCILT